MHFDFLPALKVIHCYTQDEKFVSSYMKLLWLARWTSDLLVVGSNPGCANSIFLYYFHKSITFWAGKNSKCTSLIMNGF